MIFRPELAAKVLAETKTVTRRRLNGPCLYAPGRTYAVQTGRGKRAVGRILIIDVDSQPLWMIDHADARREGFPDVPAFIAYWRELYGAYDEDLLVSRILFRLVSCAAGTTVAVNPNEED